MFALFPMYQTPEITAVRTRSKTTVKDIRDYLKLPNITGPNADSADSSQDKVIYTFLMAAKEQADRYLGNTFLNQDMSQAPIPYAVEAWLLDAVAMAYNKGAMNIQEETIPHIGMVKWITGLDYTLLRNLRVNPGF